MARAWHTRPLAGSYAGQPLASLAALRPSDSVLERAIAVAAVNAHWNRYDLAGSAANGLDLIENRGEHTAVIGRFPGSLIAFRASQRSSATTLLGHPTPRACR